jgi:hypothetical protein
MTDQINNALVIQFSDMVHTKAQQMKSRLRDATMQKMVKGQDYAYDDLGSLEAIEIVTRHQPTVGQDITHGRRRIRMREFRATIYLDKKDQLETLIDPQQNYALAVARSIYRKYDAIATEAAFASVYTGKDFSTVVTAATDGVLTVDATAGLVYEKLLEIEENFIDGDVGTDEQEDYYLTITGEENTDLKGETELMSGDFTRQFALDNKNGKLQMANGFELKHFAANAPTPILSVAASVRSCIAASKRGICVGISEELGIDVDKRPDLNGLIQVQAHMFMGAVRTEGKLIQKVTTTVS